MKIQKALNKMKKGQRLSSKSCNMVKQTKKSLLFWLISDKSHNQGLDKKITNLIKIYRATDWKING